MEGDTRLGSYSKLASSLNLHHVPSVVASIVLIWETRSEQEQMQPSFRQQTEIAPRQPKLILEPPSTALPFAVPLPIPVGAGAEPKSRPASGKIQEQAVKQWCQIKLGHKSQRRLQTPRVTI